MSRKEAIWRPIERMTPEERLVILPYIEGEEVIKHTPYWIKVRASFYTSKEWKTFTKRFIAESNHICSECKRKIEKGFKSRFDENYGVCLQTHHANTLDTTVIEHGFLEGLTHKENFSLICSDCHTQKHIFMIVAERERMGKELSSFEEAALKEFIGSIKVIQRNEQY